jgi:DNA-nicking Smr family endonuclease
MIKTHHHVASVERISLPKTDVPETESRNAYTVCLCNGCATAFSASDCVSFSVTVACAADRGAHFRLRSGIVWYNKTVSIRSIDLHGKKVADAEALFNEWLNRSRLERRLFEIQFITGNGKIHSRLKALASHHDLYHYVPLSNRGVIVIEFE